MEKSDVTTTLMLDEDVESAQSAQRNYRVSEDYVALSGSSADKSDEAVVWGLLRKNRIVLFSVCCVAATLLLLRATDFYSSRSDGDSGGLREETQDDGDEDYDHSAFYTASRPGYHFMPEKNWMNDPNAALFYLGYYHFFYQYNPGGVNLTNINWAHAVSTDLIHWFHLEIALAPDEWYDEDGVWSGSATILEDGTPAVIYTGASQMLNDSYSVQTQNLVLPADPTDPLLRKWKKSDLNPIVNSPSGISANDFRDPSTAWLEQDGLWRFVVGAKRDNADGTSDGIALLYKSGDFFNWEFEKNFREVVDTGMFECVDFFPIFVKGESGLDPSVLQAETYKDKYKYVLKSGLQNWEIDYYTLGSYSTETHSFIIDDPSTDIGKGYRYDYGKFYASKSFYDTNTGRRILWGWVNESDSVVDQANKGWASVQAIPRAVWLDGKTLKNLLVWPVEELDKLRREKTSHRDITLAPADVIKVRGGDGNQLDIQVVFKKPEVSTDDAVAEAVDFACGQGGSAHRGVFGPFGLLVHADDELTEHTGVFFYISYLNNGKWGTLACSDQSRSSLAKDLDLTVYGEYVTVLPEEDELSLRILVDHSVVETFVQGGRFAITSRVYPTKAYNQNSHLFLFNNGTSTIQVKSLDVYQMASVNMTVFAN